MNSGADNLFGFINVIKPLIIKLRLLYHSHCHIVTLNQ